MANRTVLWDEFCPSFLHNLQQLIKEAITSHSAIRHHTSPVSNVTSKWPNQRESFANRSRKNYEGKLFDSLFLIERVCYAVLHLVKMSQIMEFSLRCHKNWFSKPFLSK